MVGHRTCPANLAQPPIEKRFLLLNGRTMSVEKLFVVKPEESHENSIVDFLIESNNRSSLNLKAGLFNNCLYICHYIFSSVL